MLAAHPSTAEKMARVYKGEASLEDLAYLKQVYGGPQLDEFIAAAANQ